MLIKVMQAVILLIFLNSFSPEIQLKNTEFASKNKGKHLFTKFFKICLNS